MHRSSIFCLFFTSRVPLLLLHLFFFKICTFTVGSQEEVSKLNEYNSMVCNFPLSLQSCVPNGNDEVFNILCYWLCLDELCSQKGVLKLPRRPVWFNLKLPYMENGVKILDIYFISQLLPHSSFWILVDIVEYIHSHHEKVSLLVWRSIL